MADSNVEIYTLQLKRIVHALKNLSDGIDYCREFNVLHSIDTKLEDPKNLPEDFMRTDYNAVVTLLNDIEAMLLKFNVFQKKFETFNEPNVLDSLDMLGKKF